MSDKFISIYFLILALINVYIGIETGVDKSAAIYGSLIIASIYSIAGRKKK